MLSLGIKYSMRDYYSVREAQNCDMRRKREWRHLSFFIISFL